MVDEDSYILDMVTIRPIDEPETRRVTFPQVLERGGLVGPEEAVYWAVDQDTAEVVISRDQDWIRDRFDLIRETKVTPHRLTLIPHGLFQNCDIEAGYDSKFKYIYFGDFDKKPHFGYPPD